MAAGADRDRAGALSTLALAPFYAWPICFLTFPVLVWLIDGTGRRGFGGAFVVGWCFGFGYFVAGLYWIGIAFLVDAKTFGWLMPLAVVGLPAYLAIWTGLGVAAARLLWSPGALRILALAAGLAGSEWVRGHALSGFPWNAFGYALTSQIALAQSAALVGIWALTFLAVAIFASPAVLADAAGEQPPPLAGPGARRRHAGCFRRLRHRAPGGDADPIRRRREACASCSPTSRRTPSSTTAPSSG